MTDQWGPPDQFPPRPPGQYPPPPPPGPAPSFPPAGGPHGRVVWPWVLAGLAVAALIAAGVIVAARGDEDESTLTDSERETTTERPSTTTTSEGPSTTTTSTGGSGVSVFPDELRVGDCFDDSGIRTPEVGEIRRVECGAPHDAEAYALVILPGEVDAPYPGDDEVADMSDQLCLDQFAPYVGVEYLDSRWEVGYYTPVEESWRKFDDRGVVCYLVEPEFAKIEGSQRGTRT